MLRIRDSSCIWISLSFTKLSEAVMQIRNVYPGSEFFPSQIPGQKDPRIRIRIRIKEFKYFNPKLFLSSRKYDPGCSSRIRITDPDFDFLPVLDPGSRGLKGTGSRIRNTAWKNDQSRKYDPRCLSRIRIFIPPDPGVNKALNPGSGSATLSVSRRKHTWD